ncbi:sigma-54 dependent transcriptional regulator [bacterium]|nr:sigma-54 dependent transcriptional regulator [bacterium]
MVRVLAVNLSENTSECRTQTQKWLSQSKDVSYDSLSKWPSLEYIGRGQYDVLLFVLSGDQLDRLRDVPDMLKFSRDTRCIALILGELHQQTKVLVNSPIDDFLIWPTSKHELLTRLIRSVPGPFGDEVEKVRHRLLLKHSRRKLIGEDPAFVKLLDRAQQIATYDIPVLLLGETGTGKELFARTLHYSSPRAHEPFIPLNCAAIPADLVESELFGHAKGAFTHAVERREGLIKSANRGTLFLDEVDSIPPSMQAKLLRFLEEREFRPLGMSQTFKADVRILAAGRDDLAQKVEDGTFRDDLFYRLNVVSLLLPALRHRRQDIPVLAMHFVRKYARQLSKRIIGFGGGVISQLTNYDWPGNIRQLENTIYYAVVVCNGSTINLRDLHIGSDRINQSDLPAENLPFKEAKAKAVQEFERQYITNLLQQHNGNISQAARSAQKHRRAFWELIKKHGIQPKPAIK